MHFISKERVSSSLLFAEKFCDYFHFLLFHYMVALNYLFVKNGGGIALSSYPKKSL